MTIKECRIKCGMTPREVATKLKISLQDYLDYETNPSMMPINIAMMFSAIVGISCNNIFFG